MFDRIKKLPPLSVLTAELLLLSAGAFLAVYLIGERSGDESSDSPQADIRAEIIEAPGSGAAAALTTSGSIERLRGVRVTDGEGYVRFHVELLDSDGERLSEKLRQKEEEIEIFKGYVADPDMPSYEAFNDEYHQLINEYNRLLLKGDAAFAAFCRSTESGALADDEDFIILEDEEDSFSCTLIYNKKLKAGDTAELYSSIALPADGTVDTTYDAYIKNDDDNDYHAVSIEAGVAGLLDTGFGIHVTAEAVPAYGIDNAYAAFLNAAE